MKILIIRFSAIGDIVWTSKLVRCCKQQIPNVEIHFITKAIFRNLVEYNPYLDKVFYFENSLLDIIIKLRKEKYDFVLDLHNNLRSWIVKLALFKPFATFNKLSIQRFLFTKFQIDVMPDNLHVVDRMLNVAKKLNVKDDGKGLDFFISNENHVDFSVFPHFLHQNYIALVIGASKETKKLPLEKLIEITKKFNLPFVLIGGQTEIDLGNELIAFANRTDIYNACGKFSLAQSASIIQNSSFVIGFDTGLTHIAAAFNKKIYSVWGSTSSKGYAPYMTENVIWENKNLNCNPCSKSGRNICPKGHFKCLKEIDITV